MSPIGELDVRTVATRAVGPNAEIVGHRVEPFAKRRQYGIMGNHYELAIDVKDDAESGCNRTVKFFVKTPPESPAMRDTLVDEWVSLEEVHFFEKVYPLMMQDFGEAEERWSAACYLAKPETLVFEDLRSQSYAVRRSSIFEEGALRSALSTLARFHASSVALESRLGEPLNEAFPGAFREKIFTDVGKGGRCNELGFDTMRLIAERLGLDASMVPRILNRLCEIVKPGADRCNVICHGDLWRSNVMFDDSLSPPKCLLVDYQMLRYASPTVDLAMLLHVHATSEFRGHSGLAMLEHYYAAFRESLLRKRVAEAKIPAYESILEDYEKSKLIGLAYSALRWPAVVFADVLNDPVALEKWYFRNRIDIYRAAMDEDPAYEGRMKEYLVELFDEGKRVMGL